MNTTTNFTMADDGKADFMAWLEKEMRSRKADRMAAAELYAKMKGWISEPIAPLPNTPQPFTVPLDYPPQYPF